MSILMKFSARVKLSSNDEILFLVTILMLRNTYPRIHAKRRIGISKFLRESSTFYLDQLRSFISILDRRPGGA